MFFHFCAQGEVTECSVVGTSVLSGEEFYVRKTDTSRVRERHSQGPKTWDKSDSAGRRRWRGAETVRGSDAHVGAGGSPA